MKSVVALLSVVVVACGSDETSASPSSSQAAIHTACSATSPCVGGLTCSPDLGCIQVDCPARGAAPVAGCSQNASCFDPAVDKFDPTMSGKKFCAIACKVNEDCPTTDCKKFSDQGYCIPKGS